MATDDENIEGLSKMFQDGLDLFNKIDKTDEPTNSSEVQANIKRSMIQLEKATRLTSATGLFSRNESIDEIATGDVQYLLLPALLGTLTLKLTSGDRKEIVDVAEIYFKDFLQRCNDYGLTDYTLKEPHQPSEETLCSEATGTKFAQLQTMVYTRQSKIQRFQEQKELQNKLQSLKTNMENENVDDEIKRDYILTMVKIFIYKAIDEINSIEMEKPMLAHMEQLKDKPQKRDMAPPKTKPLRPIIITKDEVQKAVFGAGYPSLPTMTVQEFYDKRVSDGIFPAAGTAAGPASLQANYAEKQETERIEKEQNVEDDDEETLQRMRDMDEYKDEHRRGWGNRANRS